MLIDFSSAKYLVKDANVIMSPPLPPPSGSGDILFSLCVSLSIRPSDRSSQSLVNATPSTVLG